MAFIWKCAFSLAQNTKASLRLMSDLLWEGGAVLVFFLHLVHVHITDVVPSTGAIYIFYVGEGGLYILLISQKKGGMFFNFVILSRLTRSGAWGPAGKKKSEINGFKFVVQRRPRTASYHASKQAGS